MTLRISSTGICWRPGRGLFAAHNVFTALPSIETHPDGGWSAWWLWFEVSRA